MRGKQVLMESLIAHGVEHVFGNPGTTESPIYNALKARSPLIVSAGQQDTRLRLRGPVLGHDLVAMAAPLTKWSVQVERADEFGLIMHRALKVAADPPAGPVFVALPIDVLEQDTEVEPFPVGELYRAPTPAPDGIRAAVEILAASRRPVIVAGDETAAAMAELATLASELGAAVWCEGIRARQALPSAHPNFRLGLPFDTVAIRKALDGADVVLLIGGPFFEEVWYAPGSPLPEGALAIHVESSPERLAHNLAVRV